MEFFFFKSFTYFFNAFFFYRFNEEMIESLFGYAAADKNKNDKKGGSGQAALPQFIQILEPKKGQNLSILLRALNATTEEVCDALLEGIINK